MTATAVILAAGMGTRMKSARPKVLHEIAGRPMLRHLIAACEAAFDRIVVVIGPGMEAVAQAASPHASVVQRERLGTAHAALQAEHLFGEGEVTAIWLASAAAHTDGSECVTMSPLTCQIQRSDMAPDSDGTVPLLLIPG